MVFLFVSCSNLSQSPHPYVKVASFIYVMINFKSLFLLHFAFTERQVLKLTIPTKWCVDYVDLIIFNVGLFVKINWCIAILTHAHTQDVL